VGTFEADAVGRTYDTVADEYAEKFGDDLAGLPFDRRLLDEVAAETGDRLVLDIGCGPGQAAGYLAGRGAQVAGIDLSARALAIAAHHPGVIGGLVADMRVLPVRTGACGGLVLFYSLHHLRREELTDALRELRRVLSGLGIVLIATHECGGELASPAEWLGHTVDPLGATLFSEEELVGAFEAASFAVLHVRRREPLPHEYQGPRIYITARAR
jgi:SAM-dependent methyltransferase